MVAAQILVEKLLAAIHAKILVPTEQNSVGQCRFLTMVVVHITGAGNDAVQLDEAAFTTESGGTTPHSSQRVTQSPGDEFSSVEGSGFLPSEPFDGAAGNI